jgi:transglutaminase-like putative cysteine protease
VVRTPQGLHHGQRYTVWSYAPRPSPRQLLASEPRYPQLAQDHLELSRTQMPVFGQEDREATIDRLLAAPTNADLARYTGVWLQAKEVAGGATTPYAATLAVERWLRSQGGFRYEEQPPQTPGEPPLAAFLTETRAGYCQHYAGSMALMLRFLGIPSRVAVGFTSGTWKDGSWTVTDHNAHAWVEVWFKGWGWLPFDPTPGRGSIGASYTTASSSPDVVAALGAGDFGFGGGRGSDGLGDVAAVGGAADSGGSGSSRWILGSALIVGLAGGIGVVKLIRRRVRYLTRDPRRTAAATRAELADFLRDQGLVADPDATLGELRDVLERTAGIRADDFVDAAGRARYGPPAGAHSAARRARTELTTILRMLRSRLTRRMRLRGYLALRSLRRVTPRVQLEER